MMTLNELKEAIFMGETLFGFLSLSAGAYVLLEASTQSANAALLLTGLVLTLIGISSLFFGLDAYILKDSDDAG